MFNNKSSARIRIASAISAAALVATAFGLNLSATQAQDNPTATPAATMAATSAPSLDVSTPAPTAAATPAADSLGGLLGGGKFPGSKRLGVDFIKAVVDAVTQATNLTEAQLVQEMSTGKSLSDVITAHNGDPKAVQAATKTAITDQINAAVKAGTLTQARADRLTNGIDPLLSRVFAFTVPSASNRVSLMVHGLEVRELLAETATETKLTAQDIVKALTAGQTLSQIAQANSADPAAIVTAVTQKITDQINKQVKAGKLTQAQADTLLGNLNKALTDLMIQTNPLLPGGAGGFSGRRNATPTSTPVAGST